MITIGDHAQWAVWLADELKNMSSKRIQLIFCTDK
jgi:hypothetical protein